MDINQAWSKGRWFGKGGFKGKGFGKGKGKGKAKVRTSEKDLVTKVKEKVTKTKVEEETGKAEVEVSEVTKVEVEDSKAEAKNFSSYKGKGKGKAQAATGVCHYCHKYGHFEAQCRQKQRDIGYQARNVDLENPSEQSSNAGTSTQAPTSVSRNPSSSQSGTQPTNKPVIRMVSMYHMEDQPTSFSEEFELSEDSEELEKEYFGRVLRVQEERVEEESVQKESVQEFWIGDEEEEQKQDPEQDLLHLWYDLQNQEQYVRMIQVEKTKEIEVVLDSRADISLAPLWMKKYGKRVPEKARVVLRDTQGSRIKVSEQRIIQIEFEDVSGTKVKVEEIFLISSVVHPLLAVGKLLKKGWEFRNGTATGTFLVERIYSHPSELQQQLLDCKGICADRE